MRRTALAIVAIALVAPARAAAWPSGTVTPYVPDQEIVYPPPGGGAAAVVGDVNGDGLDDIAARSGTTTYVTFSRAQGGTIDATGPGGFAITGTDDRPVKLAGVGDVNGDGLADVAINGADGLHVIFGKRDGATVDGDNLGARGFRVQGTEPDGGAVAKIGDINGDGRADFLVGTRDGAALVYPPAGVAGSVIDATASGPAVARIDTWTDLNGVGDLGDLDGDGRRDVLVGGKGKDDSMAVYGVGAPGPGEGVDASDAVSRNRAFRLVALPSGNNYYVNAQAVGDLNGDGRRDVSTNQGIAYSPLFGAVVDVASFGRNGVAGRNGTGIDVGDQNSDGIDDLAAARRVVFSPPLSIIGGPAFFTRGPDIPGDIVGPIADLNGDGRPEIAASNFSNGAVDVYDSWSPARVSLFPSTKNLIDPAGYLTTSVDVVTGAGHQRGGGPVSVAVALEVAKPDGDGQSIAFEGKSWFATTSPTEHVEMRGRPRTPDALNLEPGQRYRFRVGVYTPRGGSEFWSVWQTFTYRGPRGPDWFGPPPDPEANVALATVLRGTNRRNRINGTAKNERIFGLGGADRINGGGGKDFIDGGSGNDTLIGGPGDDVLIGGGGTDKFSAGTGNDWINAYDGRAERIECGAGSDSVVADKKDRLRNCETVRRHR